VPVDKARRMRLGIKFWLLISRIAWCIATVTENVSTFQPIDYPYTFIRLSSLSSQRRGSAKGEREKFTESLAQDSPAWRNLRPFMKHAVLAGIFIYRDSYRTDTMAAAAMSRDMSRHDLRINLWRFCRPLRGRSGFQNGRVGSNSEGNSMAGPLQIAVIIAISRSALRNNRCR